LKFTKINVKTLGELYFLFFTSKILQKNYNGLFVENYADFFTRKKYQDLSILHQRFLDF